MCFPENKRYNQYPVLAAAFAILTLSFICPSNTLLKAQSASLPDGALIRNPSAEGDAKYDIYIVKYVGDKKFKRLILSPKVFLSYDHLDSESVVSIDQVTMDGFATSDLVRAINDTKIYKLYPSGDTGEKRWITTAAMFDSLGYDWDSIYGINQTDRDEYMTSSTLGSVLNEEEEHSSSNQLPVGWVERIDGDQEGQRYVTGWAADTDSPESLDMYVYNGPTLIASGRANLSRDDVNQNLNTTGNHGFSILLPDSLGDGQNHHLYIYAADINTGEKAGLHGSPITANYFCGGGYCLSLSYDAGNEIKAHDSSFYGGQYAYAPSIMYYGGKYHMWTCSDVPTGESYGDTISYQTSLDGVSWSFPQVVLYTPATLYTQKHLVHACDPSVVRFAQNGKEYFYLYYSSTYEETLGAVNALARSEHPEGPYAIFIGGDPRNDANWTADKAVEPHLILPAENPSSSSYGAGQPTVVNKNGVLHMWYTDTTAHDGGGIFFTTSVDGVNWSSKQRALPGSSFTVKYDPIIDVFVGVKLFGHSSNAFLEGYASEDGVHWQAISIANGNADNFPDYGHNAGLSGNKYGFLDRSVTTYIGYGAPWNLRENDTWGQWDVYIAPFDIE